jgi:DNA-binding phage protein
MRMTGIDSILHRIRDFARQHGQKARLAEETGIRRQALVAVTRDDWNPTADTIRVLDAAVIKLSADEPTTTQLQD